MECFAGTALTGFDGMDYGYSCRRRHVGSHLALYEGTLRYGGPYQGAPMLSRIS